MTRENTKTPSADSPQAIEPAAGHMLLSPQHPGWPEPLRALADAPSSLHAAGELPSWSRAVSIVGTRAADPEACRFTRKLSSALAAAGCAVVSGGALGIDAAAHRGALEADGVTVAVLASGLDPAYPPEHRSLFEEIRRGGLLLSEMPAGTPARGHLFLRRNRLVAALGRVVVIVQAPQRSGTLSTAQHARRLGRPVLVVPAAPWDGRGRGNARLLAAGARLCFGADQVLAALDAPEAVPTLAPLRPPRPERRRARSVPDLDPDAARVLKLLGATPRTPDSLAQVLGWSAARVSRALFQLVLTGAADQRFGSYVRLWVE